MAMTTSVWLSIAMLGLVGIVKGGRPGMAGLLNIGRCTFEEKSELDNLNCVGGLEVCSYI